MISLGLLEPSYLSMCPALNLFGHTTCLSGAARVWKSPLPNGVTSLAGERHGGVSDHALRCLWSSMMLRRLSWSRPQSCYRRYCVICHHVSLSARRWLSLAAAAAASLRTHFARLCNLLSTEVSCLSPLLCQSDKGRLFECHALN
jgi:hypothetical protein